MKSKICFLFFILSGWCLGYGQQPSGKIWSLEECIDHAVNNNVTVQRYLLQKEKTKLNLQGSKNNFLPVVDAGARNLHNWGLFIDPTTNLLTNRTTETYTAAINADFPVFNGGTTYYAIKQNTELNNAAEYDVKTARIDISFSTIASYYKILYAREQLKIALWQKKDSEMHLRQVKGSVDAGILHKRELLNMESEVAQKNLAVINSGNLIKTSDLELKQLMNLSKEGELSIESVDSLIIPDTLTRADVNELMDEVPSYLPQVLAANHRYSASKQSIRVAQSLRYPSVWISSGVITRSSSLIQTEQHLQFKNNLSEYVAFNLRVPIFNRFQTTNAIALSKIDMLLAENEVKKEKMQAEKNIQAAYLDMIAAHAKYKALQKQVAASEQQSLFAFKSYTAGTITYTEYSIINIQYFNSQIALLQAKYDYLLKRKVFDFYESNN